MKNDHVLSLETAGEASAVGICSGESGVNNLLGGLDFWGFDFCRRWHQTTSSLAFAASTRKVLANRRISLMNCPVESPSVVNKPAKRVTSGSQENWSC